MSGFRVAAQWAECHLAIPKERGFAELQTLFDKGIRGKVFNCWLESHNDASSEALGDLISVYRQHVPNLTPFPQIPQVLDNIRKLCYLGLLSDGYLEVQKRKLSALAIAHYFDAIVFSDEFGRTAWKPSALPFQLILRKLNVSGHHAVYIGDNPLKDFLGARELGMFTIRIRHADGEYSKCEPPTMRHAPNVTINSVTELQKLFMRNLNADSMPLRL